MFPIGVCLADLHLDTLLLTVWAARLAGNQKKYNSFIMEANGRDIQTYQYTITKRQRKPLDQRKKCKVAS